MKKVFNVHFSTSESDKTDVVYYVADSMEQVLRIVCSERGLLPVAITLGPSVEVL